MCYNKFVIKIFKEVVFLMVKALMALFKFNFGKFEEQEFRKFLRMSSIFSLIVGIYWTMRPLKDSLFNQLVGAVYQPYAKTVSLVLMIFFVIIYTKILDYVPKQKLLAIMPPLYYGTVTLLYAGFIWAFQSGYIKSGVLTVILGYFWYFLVESFGSVVIALFWSFTAGITKAESAKQGFPLIYMFGQLGQVIIPYLIITLPIDLGIKSEVLSMLIVAFLTLLIAPLVNHLLKKTPKELLSLDENSEKSSKSGKKEKTGFMEGLRLLFKHKYLLGIFAANFFFEFIVTVFDFNFKMSAANAYSGTELTRYYAIYSSCVGMVTLVMLLLGVSNITKRIGIGKALAIVPVVFGLEILGFLTINSLTFLYCLMITSKAINYAISGPALKQLYIPTTSDAKSKAQAWIESFGNRFSKEGGVSVNVLYKPLGAVAYRLFASCLGFAFVTFWFFIALFLGKTYKKAVDSNTTVC